MHINLKEIEAAGLDPKKVTNIARRISKAALEAKKLGIEVFGSGSGELRFRDDHGKGQLKIASLDGDFDGGAGDDCDWGDGLLRGE